MWTIPPAPRRRRPPDRAAEGGDCATPPTVDENGLLSKLQVKFGQPTNTTAGYLDGYFSFSISLDPATPIDLKGPKGTLYDIPSHAFVFLRPPGATMNHSYVHGVFQAKGLGNLLGSDATTCIELSWIGTADGVPEPGLNEWLTQARISRDLFNLFK